MKINILFDYDAAAMDFKDEEIYEDHEIFEAINRFLTEYPDVKSFQVHVADR